MSLILDALNKADQDKKRSQSVPDLNTRHGAAGGRYGGGHDKRLLAVIAAVAVLSVVAIWLWQWRQMPQPNESLERVEPPPPAPRESTPVATPVPSRVADDSRAAPAIGHANAGEEAAEASADNPDEPQALTAQSAVNSPLPEVGEEIAALYRTQVEDNVQTIAEDSVRPALSEADRALARTLWEESAGGREPQVIEPQTRTTDTETVAEVEEVASSAPRAQTLAAYGELPYLHTLPVSVQDRIPSVMYSEHHFDQGFAVLNKKPIAPGEAVASGLTLQALLADGVILNFEGETFKLDALNSWVNY